MKRIIIAAVLLIVIGFCTFGFLASWELPTRRERLPWQLGHGVLGVACLIRLIVLIARPKP